MWGEHVPPNFEPESDVPFSTMRSAALKTNVCIALGFVVVILCVVLVLLWDQYTLVRDQRNFLQQRNREAFYDPDAVEFAKARGQRVINALETYFADNGRYPANLDDLVPNHLKAMPHPLAGEPHWAYRASNEPNDQQFWLAFGIDDMYPSESFNSADKQWYGDY